MTQQRPDPGWASTSGHVEIRPLETDSDPARTADRLAIVERVHRYGWGYDERDRHGLGDCFTDDGTWEGSIMGVDRVGPFVGRAAVVEFLTEFWEVQTDQRRHLFTNVIVNDLTESTAVAHAYLLLTASTDGTMTPVTNGPYRMEMRKDDDGWRISSLLAGFDAPF